MANILKNGTVRIVQPIAEALDDWRGVRVVDPYVALLDAEIEKTVNEGRGGNPSYDLGFTQGLKKARNLYANPPRTDE